MKISIIDYRAGNSCNVLNAFSKLGVEASVSNCISDWSEADGIILPGVGAFGSVMRNLKENRNALAEIIGSGKPFLGICLGMQVLFEKSEENPKVNGLGILAGKVLRFKGVRPIPQMGWNLVNATAGALLFDGIQEFYAYFVHSYYCRPKNMEIIAATTSYGIEYASALEQKNVFATQFHPEKSGELGLRVLQNFSKQVKR